MYGDDAARGAVFYQVRGEHLPLYIDLGLTFLKLGEEGRVDVAHLLARDAPEDALEGGELEHVDVVLDDLAAHLDVDAREGVIGEAREDLSELLHERDARAHGRVDDAARDVDGIRHELAVEREAHRLRDRDTGLLLGLVRRRAEVRGELDRGEVEQGRADGRLGDEHVEAGSGDAAGGERLAQGILVDDAASARVDDPQRGLGLRELRRPDEVSRLGGLRDVDGDEVAALHELVEAQEGHAELLRAGRRDEGVVADELDAEAREALGDERADAAEADDADGLLVELDAREGRALPLAALHRGVRVGDVPREREQVADGELGRRDDVRGGRVDDHDARGRRRRHVDVVEPDARAGDDLEALAGGDRLGVHLRRRADEHRARVGEGRQERRAVGAVDLADLEVGPEGVDRGGREFFGDEHNRLGHEDVLTQGCTRNEMWWWWCAIAALRWGAIGAPRVSQAEWRP